MIDDAHKFFMMSTHKEFKCLYKCGEQSSVYLSKKYNHYSVSVHKGRGLVHLLPTLMTTLADAVNAIESEDLICRPIKDQGFYSKDGFCLSMNELDDIITFGVLIAPA